MVLSNLIIRQNISHDENLMERRSTVDIGRLLMDSLKGILFDKDGTLVSFEGFWIPFTIQLLHFSLESLGITSNGELEAYLLQELGVDPVEKTLIPGGTLAEDTTDGLIITLVHHLIDQGLLKESKRDSLLLSLQREVTSIARKNRDRIIPLGDLVHLFSQLKDEGLILGIATHDSMESTQYFLDSLEISSFFHYIGCAGEGIPSKPHPYLLHTFCETCQLKTREVAVIGDTLGDLFMAKRGGAYAIGVLSGITEKSILGREAHLLLYSVNQLLHPHKGSVIRNLSSMILK